MKEVRFWEQALAISKEIKDSEAAKVILGKSAVPTQALPERMKI